MPISESMVQDIVQEVMAKMQIADAPAGKHGIFTDMNEAIEAAKASQKIVRKMSLDQREKIITCIRRKTKENAEAYIANMIDWDMLVTIVGQLSEYIAEKKVNEMLNNK